MNYVLSYTLVALVIFLQKYECMETNKQQVKVTRVVDQYANPKYIKDIKYSISKKNDTYNNVEIRYTVVQDFPEELRIISMIYVTNSNYENATLLLQHDTSFLTDPSKYNYLPSVFTGSIPFTKKGPVELDDAGYFRFELLIPNLDKKGKYYKTDHVVIGPTDTVGFVTYFFESGFLKN